MDCEGTNAIEATDEQLRALCELGILESELGDLSFAEAEAWISELRAMREDAGRIDKL